MDKADFLKQRLRKFFELVGLKTVETPRYRITLATHGGKQPVVVNAELIKFVEQTPDTMITLINGDHFMVLESVQDVDDKAIDYARQIRSFRVV